MKGRHSISNSPITFDPLVPGIYYELGASGSSTQSLPISTRTRPTITRSIYSDTLQHHIPASFQPPHTSYEMYAPGSFVDPHIFD